jgi:hypothetical protein
MRQSILQSFNEHGLFPVLFLGSMTHLADACITAYLEDFGRAAYFSGRCNSPSGTVISPRYYYGSAQLLIITCGPENIQQSLRRGTSAHGMFSKNWLEQGTGSAQSNHSVRLWLPKS